MKKSKENEEYIETKESFALSFLIIFRILKEIIFILANIILKGIEKLLRFAIIEIDP